MKNPLFFALSILLAFCLSNHVLGQDNGGADAGTGGDVQTPANTGTSGQTPTPTGDFELQTNALPTENSINQSQLVGGGQVGNAAGGAANTGGGGRAANAGRGAARPNLPQFNFNNQNAQNQRIIRAPIRLGFDYSRPPAAQRATSASIRFRTLPRFQTANVQVGIVGKTAILRGTVSKSSDRRLAELVAQFEPGVSKVDNKIVVAGN